MRKTLAYLIILLFAFSLVPLATANIDVANTTYFMFPDYNVGFRFSAPITIADNPYRTAVSNSSYSSFWFITKTSGETYGFQSTTTDFIISTFMEGNTLIFTTSRYGSVRVYVGDLGLPKTFSNAVCSYDYVNKIATFTVTGAKTVIVTWATPVTPTPTPSPAPTTAPTPIPSVTLTVNSPTAKTYTTNNILLSLTASGGIIDKIWFDLEGPRGWNYTGPRTYTNQIYLSNFASGNYILYAFANNTGGQQAAATVNFIVSLPAPTPTPSPSVAPSSTPFAPDYFQNSLPPMTIYFRSDTYRAVGATGYGLDVDNTNGREILSASYSGNVTVKYGFRVYLIGESCTTELTDGVQAEITLTSNITGYVTGSYYIPSVAVTLGYQAVKVSVYVQEVGGEWSNQANFISKALDTNNIVGGYWTFKIYVNHVITVSSTVSAFNFGSGSYASGISNVVLTKPSVYDTMLFKLGTGDILGFILYDYIAVLGELFYVVVLLGFLGAYYVWYGKTSVILFMLVLFGGASGLVFLFIPSPVNILLWVFMAVSLAVLLFRVFR